MLWLSGATLHDLILGGHADAPFIAVIAGFLSALIVQARPRNPVGWLGLANALANATHFAANAYGSWRWYTGQIRYRAETLSPGW